MAYVAPHSKKIYIQINANGERHTTTIPFQPTQTNLITAKRSAEDAERRLRVGEDWQSVRARLRGEKKKETRRELGYYAQHFLDHAQVARSTLMSYQTIYNRYWFEFDTNEIGEIKRSELEKHLSSFSVSRKTKKNAISVLSRIFDVARKDGVITDSPTDAWNFANSNGSRSEPDPYTEKERDELLNHLKKSPIAWRYFLTAFHTGMRTGELLALEWRQLEKPYILVDQSRVRRELKLSTKTYKNRRLLAPEIVWDAKEDNPTRFKNSFVFLTPENHPFRDADWLMDKWQHSHAALGIRQRKGPYPWRHTYISLALANGATPIWVSKQTGHDIKTMFESYARWIKGREEADRKELAKSYPQ